MIQVPQSMIMEAFSRTLIFILVVTLVFSAVEPSKQADETEKELPARSYKGTFGRVSNYLMEQVVNNDSETNLATVIKRLESGKADELERVVLKKIIHAADTSDKCDQMSYVILMDNDQITENGQHNLRFRKVPTKRIDQIINFYCTQHAIKCQGTIMSNFKNKYQTIDKAVKHRVAIWMDAVSELHLSQIKSQERKGNHIDHIIALFNNIILARGHIRAVTNVRPAYEAIIAITSGEGIRGDSDKLPDAAEIILLFKELLLGSCNKYVESLGPDVFERANFDLAFHHNFEQDEQEFYLAWSRYQLCTGLKLKYDWMWTFLSPSGSLASYAASIASSAN